MKFLILGLGNPGPEYEKSRHNAGFMILDRIAEQKSANFIPDRFGKSCKISHRGKSLLLVKPETFMNLSGKAARYYRDRESISNNCILVITDDIALPFGSLRMRARGSSGGHNGLTNITEILGSDDYPRLRVGVGNDFPKGAQADYVLSPFSNQEAEKLPEIFKKGMDMVFSFALAGIQKTMSEFND